MNLKSRIRQITSRTNPEIKRVRSLFVRKYREKEGVFIAEGLRHTIEAVECGWVPETLILQEGITWSEHIEKLVEVCINGDGKCIEVSEHVMESIAKRDNAQKVLGVFPQKWQSLTDVKISDKSVWLVLDEIRDPGNLGTILRTADAVGVEGVILIGKTCDAYSVEAIRASMGSFAHVQLVKATKDEFVTWVKNFDGYIVGTHLKATHDYRKITYEEKSTLVLMGNEQAGLSDDISEACTHRVIIPMVGKVDSLNIAVATAVMLYEVKRNLL